MPVSFLIRHWKKELQFFYENLLILQGTFNSEAVHDLRVSIKKLRSYSKLYIAIFKDDEAKTLLDETKILFSVLGRQRNIDICFELLGKFKIEKHFTEIQKHFEFYLQETKKHSVSALHQYKPDSLRSLTTRIEKTVSSKDDETVNQGLEKLMSETVSEVKDLIKDFDKKYHLARKRLKDILYWSQILPEDFFFLKKELKSIKKILDDLGDSQDHEVLQSNLHHYRKMVTTKGYDEYDAVKKLEENIDNKKWKLLDKAEKMIGELLKEK